MRNAHEPSDEFVERLESHVGREIRRRNRDAAQPRWMSWSRSQTATAVIALVVLSMGAGAAVVAAAYEVQDNQRRDDLARNYEQRADLARQRMTLVTNELETIQRRASMGLATGEDLLVVQIKLAEARAQAKSFALQAEEVRLTGRDPRNDMSAPRVSGRDFVKERLLNDLTVPETAVQLERTRLKATESRFDVGLSNALDIELARMRVVEVEMALEALRRKIDIRDKFIIGGMDAVEAELRVLESEADQRRKTLAPKVELARRELDAIQMRVEVGTASPIDAKEAALRRLELDTELAKVDLDLALIRKRIDQHRAGK